MSSADEYDGDDRCQKKRSRSPEPSIVSLKSDASMDYPVAFGHKKKKRVRKESSSPPGPSIMSMKSHASMDYPPAMAHAEIEIDEPDMSHHSTVQLKDRDKDLSPDYPASSAAVMEDKGHQSSTTDMNLFRSNLQKKFQLINEGIPIQGNTRLLNEIYTNLYITSESRHGGANIQHEIRLIEKACRRQTTEEVSINCNDIFKALPGDERPIRTVLTEGIAGIGKTVSVQKFVLDWAEGKANQELDFIFPFSFRELNFKKGEHLSFLELLHWFFPETKELQMDFHHYKIMFIFDGLDEARFTLDFLNSKMLTDLTESASIDVLLSNVINRNLLPSAFLWITSRPAASSQIPSVYIDSVTEVRGFKDPQKDEYFQKRINDQILANKIITHLKSSRSLHIMCHVPVFCWFSATVLEVMFSKADTGEVPKTLTQMFTHFLIIQINRGSQKYKQPETDSGYIRDIVLNLGKLAFEHLEKGNLIFYEEDIIKCGINVQDALVYSGVCTQIFIEEVTSHLGKVYSFVHLSVQEHLAAVYAFLSCINGTFSKQQAPVIFNLSSKATLLDLLKAAVDKALQSKNGHLDLFLRFLVGLSVESNSNLLQDLLTETGRSSLSDTAAVTKTEIIKYIKEEIKKNPSVCKSINLFHCLNELNDHSLVQEVQTFLKKTDNFRPSGVTLSPLQWSALVFFLLNSEENLEVFNLQKYAASDDCLSNMSLMVRVSKKALLCDCNLTEKSCAVLAKILSSDCSCLLELDLSDNKLKDSGVKLLSKGLESPHCKLEILRLNTCSFTEEGFTALMSALKFNPSHLRALDLGWNKIGDPGIKLISDLLRNPLCKLEILKLHNCNITDEGCVVLTEALKSNSHLKQLDLSANDLGEQEIKLLSDMVEDKKYTLEKLEL